MEQQTISIAKAGITTVLNSRTSVLAAANPIYGRYDDLKSAADNIDLMTTILSRFDLIFIVRDVRDRERDRSIARHVMGVHINSGALQASPVEGELDLETIKKYVTFCRMRCSPRLNEETAQLLSSEYVKIRNDVRLQRAEVGEDTQAVPITVRQLEALVRISEALAKLELQSQVLPRHVHEAIRLFKVSTMSAASHDATGVTEFANSETQRQVERAESFLKNRLPLHSKVNTSRIIDEATHQRYDAVAVRKALGIMVIKHELREYNHGKLIERLR